MADPVYNAALLSAAFTVLFAQTLCYIVFKFPSFFFLLIAVSTVKLLSPGLSLLSLLFGLVQTG